MDKLKKFCMCCIGITIAFAIVAAILIRQLPQEANGSPIEPEQPSQTRRISLGELIHEDHLGYHYYYYHGHYDFCFYIGHLALVGTRGGMSNLEFSAERGWIIQIGTKQYRIVNYTSTWIELEELG